MRTPRRFLLPLALLAAAACSDRHGDTPAPPASTPAAAPAPAYPDGLIVVDETVGEGPRCPAGATVVVNYSAMLEDGTIWDSTEKRKRSMTWELSSPNLIRGLREGLVGMRVGGRRTLTIPPELAYGSRGRPPIPPGETLRFQVELVAIETPG